uniref:CD276 antigen-like isoform X2 n=1 Tax=Pristiophorus japonicus TaxID=55135 RepID=UPI00398E94A0
MTVLAHGRGDRDESSIIRMRCSNILSSAFLMMMMMMINSDQLQVSVWEEGVLAIHGQNTVLPCEFLGEYLLDQTIIFWQRVETKEVVFSSNCRKHRQYSGRASLFPEELKLGNASLKLEGVGPKDAGQYMCFTSTRMENSTGIISLTFAAYYTEPSLIIKQTLNGTTFAYESRGFPRASLFWYNEKHQDISALSETLYQLNDDGLYSLWSILRTNDTSRSSNYTFRLRNDVLQQSVSRTFSLSLGKLIDLDPVQFITSFNSTTQQRELKPPLMFAT